MPTAAASLPVRSRLLRAMMIALSMHGYRGTTIAEVVRIARVSKRTFYDHFPDKEACFLQSYEASAQALFPLLRRPADPRVPWRTAIERSAEQYFETLVAKPLLTRAFVLEVATLDDESSRARRRETDEALAHELMGAINR